jgi:hypothetical protein
MKLKSTIAGLAFAVSMFAVVGASQAMCTTQTCGWYQPGFTGIGWNMVPCGTTVRPAATWQQYVSGGYAPPTVNRANRGSLFLGL